MWALSVLLVSAVTLLLVTLPPTTTALPVLEQEDTELPAENGLLDRIPLNKYEDYIDLDIPLKDDPDSSLLDQDSVAETSLPTGSGHIITDHSSLQVPDTVLSDQIPGNTAIIDGDHSHEASQPLHLQSEYQPLSSNRSSDFTVEPSSLEDQNTNDEDSKDNNEPLAVEQPTLDAASAEPIPRQIIMQEDHQESTVVYPSDSQGDQPQTLETPGVERTSDEYNQEPTFHSSDPQDIELLSAQQQTIDTTTTTAQVEERIHDSTNNHDNHETLTSPKLQDQHVPTQQITDHTGESMRSNMYDEDNQEATADLSSEPALKPSIMQIETADSWNISNHDKKDNLSNTGERPVAEDLTDNYQDIGAGTILDSSTTTDNVASETALFADDHWIPTGDDDFVARTTLQSHNSTDASTEAADHLSTRASIETPEITSNSTNTAKMEIEEEEQELVKDELAEFTSQESIITTGTDDPKQSASPTDSSTGDQSVLVEDVSRIPDANADTSEKAVPPAEGSLASFFEKVKNKKQGETNKFHKKSRQSSTSFEALASQQEQINTIMATQEEPKTKLSQNSNDISTSASYAGLPWGVVHGMNRRLPDLELLYLVFENHLNPDGKLDRNQAMARFPLSMGQEQEQDELEILSDNELESLLSHQQEGINSAMMAAEKLLNKSTTNVEESSDQPNKSSGNVDGPQTEYLRKQRHDNLEGIAFDDLVEGLDDIDKFFLSVDPPDELDVGAASGSSMQELIMGKGKEILVRKLLLAFHFLQEIFVTTTKKLATKSLWYKNKASDKIHLLESFQTFDWKETVNVMRTNMRKLFDVVMEFFDDFMERDDDSRDIHEGSMHDTLDLEAIRKMGGIKL